MQRCVVFWTSRYDAGCATVAVGRLGGADKHVLLAQAVGSMLLESLAGMAHDGSVAAVTLLLQEMAGLDKQPRALA